MDVYAAANRWVGGHRCFIALRCRDGDLLGWGGFRHDDEKSYSYGEKEQDWHENVDAKDRSPEFVILRQHRGADATLSREQSSSACVD